MLYMLTSFMTNLHKMYNKIEILITKNLTLLIIKIKRKMTLSYSSKTLNLPFFLKILIDFSWIQ